MKKIAVRTSVTVFIMILWITIVFFGTVSGWFHTAIAGGNTTESFLVATENEIDNQFVGNLAMVIFKDGAIEQERFWPQTIPMPTRLLTTD